MFNLSRTELNRLEQETVIKNSIRKQVISQDQYNKYQAFQNLNDGLLPGISA